jgi:outer membrane protein insertion porin family
MGFTCKRIKYLCYIIVLCCMFFSCTVVKNAPVGKSFVYDNKIAITGNLNKDEKKKLTTALADYWDDSLYARKVQQFGIRYVLRRPPVFDTVNLTRTKIFMTGYLNSQGYYTPAFKNIDSSYSFDTVKNQIRTTISLIIDPGKTTIIDSLSYNLENKFLDSFSFANIKGSFIKPGKTPFSKQVIASELDRLVTLYRRRGYFLLTRDNLIAEVDTTNIALLQIILDPFEQAQRIAEAAERRKQNPTCIVVIENRENPDSALASNDTTYFKPYRVSNIYYYPETGRYDIPDSLMRDTASFKKYTQKNFTMLYTKGLFKLQPLREHTYQHKGALYNEDNFYKTLNNLNQVGAWERIDYRTVVRNDSVDFHYFLTPAKRETISLNLEASHSTGDFLSTSNLIGVAFNISYLNRNLWRRAIQSTTALSNGVEFTFERNQPFLQTVQSSINHTFSFPRFIPFKLKRYYKYDGVRTNLNLNAAYYDRRDFYRLRSFVSSWGYELKQKNKLIQIKFPNVEIYSLDTLALLIEAFETNPFLRTSFNTGTVTGAQVNITWTYPGNYRGVNNYFRIGTEVSTNLGIKSLQDEIYQYIKFETEYRKLIANSKKTAWAFRMFGGIGYNYGNSSRFGNTLPFFKQFVAGGPNSMRAWGLRLLGLGSSVLSDTAADFRDRYGDMQLEANAEFRYTIAQFSGVKIGGALFADMGNIWNLHKNSEVPNSEFSFNRLTTDIAIGVGTGLRFDFNYFLIRVDFGIKLKDPARAIENNGWLKLSDFTWKNYLYSGKNPVTGEYTPPTRNNYAIQLGIGLPF